MTDCLDMNDDLKTNLEPIEIQYSLFTQAWIEQIAQTIANKIEGHDENGNRHTGK